MFTSSSFEKGSSVGPESASPGHNNIATRFPVGITSLGDENQQIRIQLAVHKYNSSSNSSLTNRRSLISPIRHSFLRNSPKTKNYEGDVESSSKSEQKSGNRYEGVGTFPTVHLKKSAVLYRPIRRFNEVKVPYPELPVSRFLNHLPELCPDLKSSTRSVLDVLQDLSRKRIHSKDEDDCSKPRSKGLGGDMSMDPQAAYKPLFVKKPKVNAVITRDNTTQTLSSQALDTSGPQCSNVNTQSEPTDPRAELRRKLARQYNEISASLSSSIAPSFTTKRKIDKVGTATTRDDEQQTDSSASKKPKMLENHINSFKQNGISKVVNGLKTNSNESSSKLSRKTKLNETNSTSPNKDRLTTIFLDMQSTSPKAQIFQNSSDSGTNSKAANNDVLDSSFSKTTTTFGKDLKSTFAGSPPEPKTKPLEKSDNNLTQSPKLSFMSPGLTTSTPTSDSEQKNNTAESNKSAFKLPVSKAGDSSPISGGTKLGSSPPMQFTFKPSNGSNLNFGTLSQTSSFNSTSGSASLGGGLSKTENVSKNISGKEEVKSGGENNQTGVKAFTFGSSNTNELKKPDFSAFKFGADNKSSPTQNQQPILNSDLNAGQKADQTVKPDALNSNTSITAASNVSAEFSFGSKPKIPSNTSTSPPTGAFQFGQASNNSILSNQMKPSFAFGQSVSPASQQKLEGLNKTDEKSETAKTNAAPSTAVTTQNSPSINSSSLFGQNIQSPGAFIFGKKPENVAVFDTGQNMAKGVVSSGQNTLSQTNVFSQSNIAPKTDVSSAPSSNSSASTSGSISSSQNSTIQTLSTSSGGQSNDPKSLFTFGQKPVVSEATSVPSSIPGNASAEQKSQPDYSFAFGQKPATQESGQNKPAEAGGFGQKNQSNMFSFGSKTTAPGLGQNNEVPANTFSQTGSTQTSQNLNKPPNQPTSNQPSLFGQSVSQVSSTAQTTTQAGKLFGQPSAPSSLGQNNTTFGTKSNIFGATTQPITAFGTSTTTQSTSLFGTSTTTQATPAFGASTTTQSAPAFGVSTTTQSTSLFGTSTTTQSLPAFGASTTTQSVPAFGTSTTTQSTPAFGTSTSTQSTPAFGASTTTQSAPVFGTSGTTQSTPAFGVSTTTQSSTLFGTSTTTQSTSLFGTSTATQAGPAFGTSATTQSTSTFGALPTSQPTTGFGSSTMFGTSVSSQAGTGFGTGTASTISSTFGSAAPTFGSTTTTTQAGSGFGAAPTAFGTTSNTIQSGSGFGSSTSIQSSTGFGASSAPQTSFSQSFGQNGNKTGTSLPQSNNIFGQTTVNQNPVSGTGFPSSVGTNFNATGNQNNIFGPKTNTQTNVFGQDNKTQPSPFNQTSTTQAPGTQNNFSFGMSTSNATGFTSSPPNTTTASVFNFGGNNSNQRTAYNFGGSGASTSSNNQTPFAFNNTPTNSPFKFGASTTKESPAFGGGNNTSTFSFGAPMNNNATSSVAQPSGTNFNFGNTQTSTPGFNFNPTSSPSVFSFGGSASSTSSSSTFNFGTPQPNAPFGQNATPSPATPFSVPGTFSIGSGSSQSRPRASSRLRRRP